MKTNKAHIISIKSIIGCLLFMGFGLSFIFTNKIFSAGKENWIRTTGKITRLPYDTRSKSNYTVVLYYVNQEEYEKAGDVYKSTYYIGQEVPIKYNPSNHGEFTMIVDNTITIPFIVAGSIIVAISVAMLAVTITKGISAKKQFATNNNELRLDYIPNFMLEYVPLKAENEESYKFKQQIKDFNNFEVTDSKGKVIFFTKRLKKGFTSSATYQLIDSLTKQTTVVNLKKSTNAGKTAKGGINVKVNNLPIDSYFETRHITYNISKEGNETKYTLLNNGSTLGFIYERNNQSKSFEIETAKENIDDLSLFALCLTIR